MIKIIALFFVSLVCFGAYCETTDKEKIIESLSNNNIANIYEQSLIASRNIKKINAKDLDFYKKFNQIALKRFYSSGEFDKVYI